MLPIFLDTDIGDDIDDALALAVILNSPELELRGVSTVFRDAPRRASLARQVLDLNGRNDIPVFAGVSRPLLQRYEDINGGANVGRQFEALDPDLPVETEITALEAMKNAVLQAHQNGEKLTLVAIGPLTNLALLFQIAPEIVPLCRVAIMGGKWNPDAAGPAAEWNIVCDPEAAAMVFASGVELSMVGLDVTTQCVLEDSHIAQFRAAQTPSATFLADLIALWSHQVTLHDPLTVLALFDDCVRFERRPIQVGLCGARRGVTELIHGPANCSVALEVDAPRAVGLFMERVLGNAGQPES